MKDGDQKRLELIYESLIKGFSFIKEEETLIENLSQLFASEISSIVKSRKHLNHLPTSLYNTFWIYLTVFHHNIPEDILQKLNLDINTTKYFDSLYEGYVVRELAKNTLVQKRKDQICLVFSNPFSEKDRETVLANDSSKLKRAFDKYLRLHVEFIFTDKTAISQIEREIDWVRNAYEWRKQQIKLQKMKENLPELEGIF